MRNPEIQWSWRKTFKSATGSAASGASAGAMIGIIDPTGASAITGAAIGGATCFVGSVVGDYRVIFAIIEKDALVLRIGHRRDIYK